MKLASVKSIDTNDLEKEFELKNQEFKKHNPEKYEESKNKYIIKKSQEAARKNLESHNGFDLDSKEGENYLLDMNCALQFALDNRKTMIKKIIEFWATLKSLCLLIEIIIMLRL